MPSFSSFFRHSIKYMLRNPFYKITEKMEIEVVKIIRKRNTNKIQVIPYSCVYEQQLEN